MAETISNYQRLNLIKISPSGDPRVPLMIEANGQTVINRQEVCYIVDVKLDERYSNGEEFGGTVFRVHLKNRKKLLITGAELNTVFDRASAIPTLTQPIPLERGDNLFFVKTTVLTAISSIEILRTGQYRATMADGSQLIIGPQALEFIDSISRLS